MSGVLEAPPGCGVGKRGRREIREVSVKCSDRPIENAAVACRCFCSVPIVSSHGTSVLGYKSLHICSTLDQDQVLGVELLE